MKSYIALALSLFAAGFAADSVADTGIQMKFVNKSKWPIHHLYLAPTKEQSWGPDQLGSEETNILQPEASFTVMNIPPNKYDMKIVDADGDECVVPGIKIAASEVVEITDENLLGCQAATENNASDDADEGEGEGEEAEE
jgi:hypothetical protein